MVPIALLRRPELITATAPDLFHLSHPSHPKTTELANRRGAMPLKKKGVRIGEMPVTPVTDQLDGGQNPRRDAPSNRLCP